MSSRCKSCGGTLEYDITLAKVKCLHCDSIYNPEDFDADTAAEEQVDKTQDTTENLEDKDKYETTIFICPSCGAELSASEFDAVDYCLYCGTFVTLNKRLIKIKKPSHIIPFTRTKEDCKKAYRDALKYNIYAPSEFRDEKFLDGFKGIYMPYWNFHYTVGPNITIRGEEEKSDGDYLNVQTYDTTAFLSTEIDNICYDASSSFDDEISLRIAPFSKEKLKAFNPSYMFGFFGDVADVNQDVYSEDSDTAIREKLWKDITDNVPDAHTVSEPPEAKDFKTDFNLKSKAYLTMLPVWFLTWRKGDRLAYSVVNGDTGEAYTEIPVSIFRYLLFSLLTAIPIFFALNTSFTFSASDMLVSTIILSLIMIMLYVHQVDKIVRRMMHKDDKGFLESNENFKKASEEVSDNLVTSIWKSFWGIIFAEKYAIFVVIACCLVQPEVPVTVALLFLLGSPIYTFYRLYYNAKFFKGFGVWFDVAGALFAIIFASGMLIYDPAPDIYYYFSAILCMLGIALAAINLVRRYNDFLTRPAPHFFKKEGRV